jgi:hypothetical protein
MTFVKSFLTCSFIENGFGLSSIDSGIKLSDYDNFITSIYAFILIFASMFYSDNTAR